MTVTGIPNTPAEEKADAAIVQVLAVIDQALATAMTVYPYDGVIRGPGMFFDFCAMSMRTAKKNVLADPSAFSGNLVRARHCLKDVVKDERMRNRRPNQEIVEAADAVGSAMDTALVEIRLARKEARQGKG